MDLGKDRQPSRLAGRPRHRRSNESRKHGGSLSIAWMDPTFFAVTRSHFGEQMHSSSCNRSGMKVSLQPDVPS